MADKNALAELAEWMGEQVDAFPVTSNQFPEQDERDKANAQKIQRIVAELAKVQDVTELHNLKPVQNPNSWQCYDAVVNCRAIAEEREKE